MCKLTEPKNIVIEFKIFYLFILYIFSFAEKRKKMQGLACWQILRFHKCQLPAGGRWLLPHTGAYSNPVFFSVFPQIIFYSSFLFYTYNFTSANWRQQIEHILRQGSLWTILKIFQYDRLSIRVNAERGLQILYIV